MTDVSTLDEANALMARYNWITATLVVTTDPNCKVAAITVNASVPPPSDGGTPPGADPILSPQATMTRITLTDPISDPVLMQAVSDQLQQESDNIVQQLTGLGYTVPTINPC